MTGERRDLTHPERRRLDRAGGRRATDSEPSHGARSRYQQGCRCTPCRSSNAAYEAAYRDRKRRGLPMLGSVVSAVETWRQLRLLTTEYESAAALAQRLGCRNRHLQYGDRVTLRTVLRIRRVYQLDILAGLEPQPSA